MDITKLTDMKAYKLFRLKKNGAITPLFIDKTREIEFNVWMDAELHPTKGFAERPGWHCGTLPQAPHLTEKGRVWCEVEVEDYYGFDRPKSQGGFWIIANRMIVRRVLTDKDVESIIKASRKRVTKRHA